jgi:hypothetical protein
MTKFSGETDTGYVRVRDQLWLWVDAVNKKTQEMEGESTRAQAQPRLQEELQIISGPDHENGNQREHGRTEDARQSRQNERGAISSGGGAIFMGNVSAGRDFTYNSN